MSRLFLFALLIAAVVQEPAQVTGRWLGILKIKSYNFRLYIDVHEKGHAVYILNPKANRILLDTLFFRNDSLHFIREDFSAKFAGKYDEESSTIYGEWTSDDHKKYPIAFKPVDPDTITGLRPRTNSIYSYQKPIQKKDGLITCSLRDVSVDHLLVDSLTHKIMDETFPNIHSLLIARDNCLVYEEYFYGWKAEDLWLIQSVTKSFVSALAGIAIAKGEIKNVNEPICQYLPEYQNKTCNSPNKNITIHQLLSMSTGLDWNELEFDYYDNRNTANQCGKAPDPFDCVLSRRRVDSSGTVFAYNSMNHSMMNKILRKATRIRNPKELKQRLLEPLGIERVDTGVEGFGVIGDISLTPRDMLKFGMLYLNKGIWNGKEVVPSGWVTESTSPKIRIRDGEGYGYFWWTKQFNVGGKQVDTFYAWGYAGQYIFIVPELELVVVMTGSNWIMDEKKYAFAMMERFILPAF